MLMENRRLNIQAEDHAEVQRVHDHNLILGSAGSDIEPLSKKDPLAASGAVSDVR